MEVTSGDLRVHQGTPVTITGLDEWTANIAADNKLGYDHMSSSMGAIYACAWDRKVLDVYDAGEIPERISSSSWEVGTPVATYGVRNILYLVASGLYADCITLRAYDVSDPGAMVLMDGCSFHCEDIVPFDLDVAGNYAYVATMNGIVVFNVSDPGSIEYDSFVTVPPTTLPSPITTYTPEGASENTVYSVRRHGDYLFCCGRAGFFVIEL